MTLEQIEAPVEDQQAQEEQRLNEQQEMASAAKTVWDRIIKGVQNNTNLFDRMDDDYDLYTLKQWQPDEEEPIAIEDAYTTNAPKVLADKIISFISQTTVTKPHVPVEIVVVVLTGFTLGSPAMYILFPPSHLI